MRINPAIGTARDMERARPSKDKFVRDMMIGLARRDCDRKEAEARAIIEEPCAYYTAKKYSRGKKHTKQAYQC